jgi:hypothetical protein
MLIRSNFPAILNDLQLIEELFIDIAPHVLGARGEFRRDLVIAPELPYNITLAPERAIDPLRGDRTHRKTGAACPEIFGRTDKSVNCRPLPPPTRAGCFELISALNQPTLAMPFAERG